MSEVNVYAMNDSDWVVARSEEEAAKFWSEFAATLGMYPEDVEEDLPVRVSDEEMRRLQYHTDAGSRHNEIISFAEQLARLVREGEEFPCYFATAELP